MQFNKNKILDVANTQRRCIHT